ncbi:hypothetical protein Q7P37_001824 [Cladosporium fusiforme]
MPAAAANRAAAPSAAASAPAPSTSISIGMSHRSQQQPSQPTAQRPINQPGKAPPGKASSGSGSADHTPKGAVDEAATTDVREQASSRTAQLPARETIPGTQTLTLRTNAHPPSDDDTTTANEQGPEYVGAKPSAVPAAHSPSCSQVIGQSGSRGENPPSKSQSSSPAALLHLTCVYRNAQYVPVPWMSQEVEWSKPFVRFAARENQHQQQLQSSVERDKRQIARCCSLNLCCDWPGRIGRKVSRGMGMAQQASKALGRRRMAKRSAQLPPVVACPGGANHVHPKLAIITMPRGSSWGARARTRRGGVYTAVRVPWYSSGSLVPRATHPNTAAVVPDTTKNARTHIAAHRNLTRPTPGIPLPPWLLASDEVGYCLIGMGAQSTAKSREKHPCMRMWFLVCPHGQRPRRVNPPFPGLALAADLA